MLGFYKSEGSVIVRADQLTEGCWVNAVSPNAEEIRFLIDQMGIDSGFISAALDEEESSRIETEDDQTLIIIDTPVAITEGDSLAYTTMPIGIIVTKTNVVTICLNETSPVTDITNGFTKNLQTAMKTRFLLSLLLRVAQSFLIRLKHINKMTTQVENELQRSMRNKELLQLAGLQKSLVYFSTSLKADEVTLEKILRGRVIKLYEEDQDLLEDVLIEFKQAVDMSNIYSTILANTMEACSSLINNNMNNIMKVLTIITVLMEIPNIIFSFYGMNTLDLEVFVPYTWFAVLSSLVLLGVVGFFFWKKKF